MSHELKTPLTVLSGFLETLEVARLDRTRAEQGIAHMRAQTTSMQRLVEDLLMLSSLEDDSLPMDEQVIDLTELKTQARTEAQMLSGGAHAVVVEAPEATALRGGRKEICSLVSNLLSNAIRYTPVRGTIAVRWTITKDGSCELAVTDSGIGISREHIPRLTERFYRVDSGRSRSSGGTGLGLAIVKHVLARHQGRLEIRSQPGEGSTFTATFPLERVLRLSD